MVSVTTFARQNGFMPATVTHGEHTGDRMILFTLDPDPDTDIIIPDGPESPYRRGNTPESDDE